MEEALEEEDVPDVLGCLAPPLLMDEAPFRADALAGGLEEVMDAAGFRCDSPTAFGAGLLLESVLRLVWLSVRGVAVVG